MEFRTIAKLEIPDLDIQLFREDLVRLYQDQVPNIDVLVNHIVVENLKGAREVSSIIENAISTGAAAEALRESLKDFLEIK